MSILEKVKKIGDDNLADEDHPDKKDITAEEFKKGLDELAEKYKNQKPVHPMTEEEARKREDDILATLNRTKDPY